MDGAEAHGWVGGVHGVERLEAVDGATLAVQGCGVEGGAERDVAGGADVQGVPVAGRTASPRGKSVRSCDTGRDERCVVCGRCTDAKELGDVGVGDPGARRRPGEGAVDGEVVTVDVVASIDVQDLVGMSVS